MTRFQLPPIARRWRFAAALAGVTALAGGGVLIAAPSNPATASAFHPMVATRVLDTREGTGTPLGELSTLDVLVPGLPDDTTAISVNVTAVDGTEASYITVYPAGAAARPTTSTVNWDAAGAVANSATVVVNADHMVRVFNLKGTVNVVIDLLGFYAPVPAGGGAVGPAGPAGPQGIQGIPGVGGPAAFLYASNTSLEIIETGWSIAFDTIGPTQGGFVVGAAPDFGTSFRVPNSGVYKVSFGVLAEAANQLEIEVNNEDPETGPLGFGAAADTADPELADPNEGTGVVALVAGDTITLVNEESGPAGISDVTLSATPRGGQDTEINAWIMIEQLSS